MKLLLYSFVLGLLVSAHSFGQVTLAQTSASTGPLQNGFALITPVAGNGEGLSVSETFGEQIGSNVFQASVLGSPLVTLTDVVVSVDPKSGVDNGIAIVNPNTSAATVTLSLGNPQGTMIATRTLTIGPHQQISQFATELFLGEPHFSQPFTGLLFISSDVPIGVVALAFSGATFTSLPVPSQLSGSIVLNIPAISTTAPATIAGSVTTTSNGVTITSTAPTTFSPLTPTFNGVPTPPTLLPPPTVTSPSTMIPLTGSPSSAVTATGSVPTFATPSTAAAPQTFVFPTIIAGVGGIGALLLPQVATGAGWVSQITTANTSSLPQTVRVDFFDNTGVLLSTVPGIVIAPGGVATLVL